MNAFFFLWNLDFLITKEIKNMFSYNKSFNQINWKCSRHNKLKLKKEKLRETKRVLMKMGSVSSGGMVVKCFNECIMNCPPLHIKKKKYITKKILWYSVYHNDINIYITWCGTSITNQGRTHSLLWHFYTKRPCLFFVLL